MVAWAPDKLFLTSSWCFSDIPYNATGTPVEYVYPTVGVWRDYNGWMEGGDEDELEKDTLETIERGEEEIEGKRTMQR